MFLFEVYFCGKFTYDPVMFHSGGALFRPLGGSQRRLIKKIVKKRKIWK